MTVPLPGDDGLLFHASNRGYPFDRRLDVFKTCFLTVKLRCLEHVFEYPVLYWPVLSEKYRCKRDAWKQQTNLIADTVLYPFPKSGYKHLFRALSGLLINHLRTSVMT